MLSDRLNVLADTILIEASTLPEENRPVFVALAVTVEVMGERARIVEAELAK